ncbi:MAG: hypothetical protein PHV20_11090 [Bacteroidales bacterium]|nr:hypothetical protein [Bacteroidales bacterium]
MKKSINYTLAFIFGIHTCFAQKKAEQDTTFNQKVVLEREFNPIFRDATRLELYPKISEPAVQKSPIQYQFNKLEAKLPLQWKTLPPEKKMDSYDYSNQTGYVNLGFGLPANSYLNAGGVIFDDEINQLNYSVDHRSIKNDRSISQTNDKQSVYSADTKAQFNFNRPIGEYKMDASMSFSHANFNYFGTSNSVYIPIPTYPTTTQEQSNNVLNIQAHIQAPEGSDINYTAGIQYNYFDKKYGSDTQFHGGNEHHITIDGDAWKELTKSSKLGLHFALNNFIYTNDSTDILYSLLPEYKAKNSGHLTFAPHYDLTANTYKISLGINTQFSFYNYSKAYISPLISGIWEFSPKFFLLGNMGGGTQYNSFTESDNHTRYLNPAIRLNETFTPIDANFTIKSNLFPRLEFGLNGGYKSGDEYYFMSQMVHSVNSLFPIAMTNTKQYSVGIEAKYSLKDLGDISFKLTKYSYDLKAFSIPLNESAVAWNKPSLELSLDADFRITNKINAGLHYYIANDRYGLDEVSGTFVTKEMNPINLLNLNSRYTINKNWSAFAQFNNILFQNYDLWYGMPAQNFNFVVGAGFSY